MVGSKHPQKGVCTPKVFEFLDVDSLTSSSVVLDLQGQQYIGTLLPGPTALLLGKHSDEHTLKVEGITNDFLCTNTVQSTVDMKNPLDFLHHEENVNRKKPDEAKAQGRQKKQVKKR